ncbi:MAG: hypothetical protein NTY12_04045 [Candidatus Falkowbacteria bacterium]|nr:hypothetical protein [Candidatus Falkowbacteria bacterium]
MRGNFLKFLANHKLSSSLFPIILLVVLFVFFPRATHAVDLMNGVTSVVGLIVYAFVWILGKILIVLINLVIWVATYNDFINAKAVSNGWVILRDLCNMFFVLILLVIAFATTLNRESYAMKALLPKFIIAAILINFSKLICGVIIDFAQVIMLTFVNGFRDIGGGNLADMLGITSMLGMDQNSQCAKDITSWTIMGTFVLALLYVLVATVVITVILFVLVMRMVMIWIYVVLSPMAWLLSVLPATQKYANQWWQQFAEAVSTGPILAFFIWLSFASVTVGMKGTEIMPNTPKPSAAANEAGYIDKGLNNVGDPCAGNSENGTPDSMLKFVISIGLLMGGLMVTKQAGGAIGGIAGGGLSKITNAAKGARDWASKNTIGRAKTAAIDTSKAAARTGIGMAGFAAGKAGKLTNKVFGGKAGDSLQKGGQFMKDWRTDMKETRKKAKETKMKQTLEKLGMKETSMASYGEFQKTTLARSAKGVAMAGAGVLTGNPLMMAGGVIAGAGMTGYSLGSKKLAGGIKNWAANREKNKNLEELKKQTNSDEHSMTDDKQKGLDNLALAHSQRVEKINSREEDELDRREKEKENYIAQNPEDAAEAEKTWEKDKEKVKNKYASLREASKDKHDEDVDTLDQNLRADPRYKGKISDKQQYYEASKEVIDRDNKTKTLNDEKAIAIAKNKELMEAEIEAVNKNFKGSTLAKNMEVAKVKNTFGENETKINESHQKKMEDLNFRYKDVPAEASQLKRRISRGLDATGNYVEKYQPNRVSIKAAEAGAKELKNAKDTVYQLGVSDVGSFKGNDFATGKGLTSEQTKMFKELSGAGEDAKKAINNMVKGLKDMKANSANLSSAQKGMIHDMKKGFAYFQAEKPGEAAALQSIMSELNNFDTGHDKGWIRVEDFGPKKKT